MITLSSMLNLTPHRLEGGTPATRRGYAARLSSLSSGLSSVGPDEIAQSIERAKQLLASQRTRRNISEVISLHQVAEGALSSLTSPLLKLNELATQAASDLLNAQDRAILQQSADHVVTEIARVFDSARFQGQHIFDGSFFTDASSSASSINVPGLNFDSLFTHEGLDRNDDHDVVFVIDSSKSTNPEISEIIDKINEYAESYQGYEGSLSVGIVFTPIQLNGGRGTRPVSAHDLVNLTEDEGAVHADSIKRFLNEFEPEVGHIRFDESITYADDEMTWRDEAHRSLILIGSNGGEGQRAGVVETAQSFAERDRSMVSAIGLIENGHPDSTFLRDQVVPAGDGVYQTYTSDLELDLFASQSRGHTRVISAIDLSTTLTARESQDLIATVFDQILEARSTLGVHHAKLETQLSIEDDRTQQLSAQEGRIVNQRFAQVIATQAREEISQQQHIAYQSQALRFFGDQLLTLVTHTDRR